MPKVTDPNILSGLVDDYSDVDPDTNDSSPGWIDGHRLKLIAKQVITRIFSKKQTKYWIYVAEGTREIFYKPSPSSPAWVRMGVSLTRIQNGFSPRSVHAVPMETYAEKFLGQGQRGPDFEWLKRNNFEPIL